jgi:sortase B
MFSELDQYEKIDFYKKTPVVEFNTLENNYQWKIYAVFISNANPQEDNDYVFNYIYPHMNGENFNGFIEEVNKRRLYVTDVDITDDDKMLVLSTCVRTLDTVNKYGKTTYRADARLVIVARALRNDESADVDVSKAYVNKNPKYPQIYYDKYDLTNPYINDEKWYPAEV